MAEKAQAQIVISGKDDTGAAFASAKRNLQALQASATAIVGRIGAIGAAVGAAIEAFEHINPKPIYEQADALGKLSQKTGISVQTLSTYEYAAKLANLSNEDLNTGLKKLSLNIAAGARGEAEQVAAFQAMGISQKFLRDNINSTDKVLEVIAERFSTYNDGAKKNALANATLGKTFEGWIPLLNDGREGLRKAGEELKKFGGVLTDDFADKAQQFNDNLTRLDVAGQKLKIQLATGLIDALVRITDRFVDAAREGGLFLAVLEQMAKITPNNLVAGGLDFLSGLIADPTELEKTTEAARHLNKVVEDLKRQLAADPGNQGLIQRLDEMRLKADAANEALRGLRIGGGRGVVNPELVKPSTPDKKDAPELADPGKVEALLKKQLEGRLKALEAGLERERDLFQFSDERLTELFQHGDVSVDEFYEAKSKAQLEFLARQQEGFTKEIEALKDHKRKTKDAATKEDDQNKINELIDRQAKAFREAGQAAEKAGTQQDRSTEDLLKNLRDIDAQIAELSGDKYGAELLRNAQRLDDARKTLGGKTGGDPTRLAKLTQELDLQAKANREQEATGRLTEQHQRDEELFLINAQRLSLGRNETERGLLDLHTKQLAELDAQVARYGELVQRSAELNKGVADPALVTFYENLKLARERAFDAKDPGLIRFNELAAQGGESIAQSFEDAIIEGKKLRDVVRDLGKDLFRLVFRDLVTKPIGDDITKWIKGLGAGGTGGGAEKLINNAAKALGLGGSTAAPAGARPLTTGDFTRTDHDTMPVALPTGTIPTPAAATAAGASPVDLAQQAATERATVALQALAEAANAASGALGKPPGTVAPTEPVAALPGAATPAVEASTAEADAISTSADSADAAAKSLDGLGQTATTNAATFDTAISSLAQSAIRGSTALGGMPGALSVFVNYLTQLLSSTSSGGGGGLGSLLALFGGSSSGGGTVTSGTGLEGMSAESLAYFWHDGGIVSRSGRRQPVDASLFLGAPRYHDGGTVLGPNEVPAILMGGPKGKREEVLHADDPRHQDNLTPAFRKFLATLIDGKPAHVMHDGGIVQRYHDGGVVGLLDRGQMNPAVTGGGGQSDVRRAETATATADSARPLAIYVQPAPNMSRDSATQHGVAIGQGIQRVLRRNGG